MSQIPADPALLAEPGEGDPCPACPDESGTLMLSGDESMLVCDNWECGETFEVE